MSDGKPVRSDSVRNRVRLLESAREVFAERGFAATLDDIARHAGLGTGTAYRHFPNKQAIAAEVLADATEQIAVDAREALAIDDPWEGLVTFFERSGRRQARDRVLYEALTGRGDDEMQARIWPGVLEAISALFDRAQRAGAVRSDAVWQDVMGVYALLGPAFEMSRSAAEGLWERYLALILDGLRATDRPPLPGPPPTSEALAAIMRAGKKH